MQRPATWDSVIAFHGHTCPGIAYGVRACLIGLDQLGLELSADLDLVTLAENSACGVDAVRSMLGCREDKGNLIIRDQGKQVFTFIDRNNQKAVRVCMSPRHMPEDREAKIDYLLSAPQQEVAEVELVDTIIPEASRAGKTVG